MTYIKLNWLNWPSSQWCDD